MGWHPNICCLAMAPVAYDLFQVQEPTVLALYDSTADTYRCFLLWHWYSAATATSENQWRMLCILSQTEKHYAQIKESNHDNFSLESPLSMFS